MVVIIYKNLRFSSLFVETLRFFLVSALLFCIKINAEVVSKSFNFDTKGNFQEVMFADGSKTMFEYDLYNQPIRITNSNGQATRFQYDLNGNCTQMEDGYGITKYEYDLLDRLISVVYPGKKKIQYKYDLRGRLKKMIYPSGYTVDYFYNLTDRLERIRTPDGETEYLYDYGNNTLFKMCLPNGCETEFTYDNAKRITFVSHKRANGELIVEFSYEYDGNGNQIHIEEISPEGKKITEYTYDKLNRLVLAKYQDDYEKFTYDELGNRLSKETSQGVIYYEYDNKNLLIKVRDSHFLYDDRGNVIKKVTPSRTCEYAYDSNDNLIEYKDEKNTVSYRYDGLSRRVAKTVNGETTLYINDALSPITQVLVETSERKDIKAQYTYGLSRISQTIPDDDTSYYLYDLPGKNVVALLDSEQNFRNTYQYNSFGVIKNSIGDFQNSFCFSGESYEKETGLIYLRNRYYDPEIGRFITADHHFGKLMNPQSLNPYAYVSNNPINYVDPLGLKSAKACAYLPGTQTPRGQSLMGHGFWILTKDNGEVITLGRYAGGIQENDSEVPGTFSFEWTATDEQIDRISKAMEKGKYVLPSANCVDGLERGLKILGVKHPSFNIIGVSTPIKACLWLESLNGKNDLQKSMKQDMDFIAEPDLFYPSKSSPSVTVPSCPCSENTKADFGGVSLNRAAQFVSSISDIVGATYDSSTGQLILIGSENYSLPSVDFDDLAVAVRSVYGLGSKPPQNPGVSIDWNTANDQYIRDGKFEKLLPMPVRYLGETEGTRFGYTMYEADRILKCLSLGKDNVSKKRMNPKVKGYSSLPHRSAASKDFPRLEIFNRMWFQPKDISLSKSSDNKSFIFDKVEMQVLTESQMRNKTKGHRSAEDFANHFTNHFDEFAIDYPILGELKRLGKITGIVKWIKDNNIPLDLTLFKNYTPKFGTYYETPTTYTGYLKGVVCYVIGGVSYSLSQSNFHEVYGNSAASFHNIAIDSRPSDDVMNWNLGTHFGGKEVKAVAYSIEPTQKVGNFRQKFIDMHFPLSCEFSLELTRYYNSFNDRISGFGRGWEILPALLHFTRSKYTVTWKDVNVTKVIYPEFFLFEEGQEFHYSLQGLNSELLPVYKSMGKKGYIVQQNDGVFVLYHDEGQQSIFHPNGSLAQKKDRQGKTLDFLYDSGRLSTIASENGKEIHLRYENGRIVEAIGPGGKTVYYSHDDKGQLSRVFDKLADITFYQYDADKNLNGIFDAKRRLVFSAVYDGYHRTISETRGKLSTKKKYSLKDHSLNVQASNQIEMMNQYDENYRLLHSRDSLGRLVEFVYENGILNPTIIKDNFGSEVQYSYDTKGNLRAVKRMDGSELKFWYDASNRLTAWEDARGNVEVYKYDELERLSVVYPNVTHKSYNLITNEMVFRLNSHEKIEYTYDGQSRFVSSIHIEDTKVRDFKYNTDGLDIEVADPFGHAIRKSYDERSRLISVSDMDGKFDYFYDERDRIIKVSSPVGYVEYRYDEVDNLIWIKDANGNETYLDYDENYNLTSIIDAEGGVTKYEYNDASGLIRIILPNGSSKEIVYDVLNRPIQEIIGK